MTLRPVCLIFIRLAGWLALFACSAYRKMQDGLYSATRSRCCAGRTQSRGDVGPTFSPSTAHLAHLKDDRRPRGGKWCLTLASRWPVRALPSSSAAAGSLTRRTVPTPTGSPAASGSKRPTDALVRCRRADTATWSGSLMSGYIIDAVQSAGFRGALCLRTTEHKESTGRRRTE